jgi:DNA-binding LytR/AlgR family response regulator
VYVIDRESKKYMADKSLAELENELDHSIFFRANRQFIVNFNFIKSFKSYQKVKLLVTMDVPDFEKSVIISQQISPAFKKWMNDD